MQRKEERAAALKAQQKQIWEEKQKISRELILKSEMTLSRPTSANSVMRTKSCGGIHNVPPRPKSAVPRCARVGASRSVGSVDAGSNLGIQRDRRTVSREYMLRPGWRAG